MFENPNINLHDLSDDELNYVSKVMDHCYSWDEALEDIIDVPKWLPKRSKDWKSSTIMSYNTGEAYYGTVALLWDTSKGEGILYEYGGDDYVGALAKVKSDEPEEISPLVISNINDWYDWLVLCEDVFVSSWALSRETMLKFMQSKEQSYLWKESVHGDSPEKWINTFFGEA